MMDDLTRSREVKKLFERLIDLPEESRAQALKATDLDAEVRQEVEELLRWDRDTGAVPSTTEAAAPELSAHQLDDYVLLREIGRGGSSVVFLAHRRNKSWQQQVAVKILDDGSLRRRDVARFRSEVRLLAALEHPNVARLLDSGQTAEGAPYLVMEYVDGVPITEFCERQRFTVTQRLELFRQLCETVSFLHKNLTVHRDLKPANILVSADGRPRVLDFGLAKLLDHRADEITTAIARRVTPAYSSPEQLVGETITTATDCFSLGVVLHEILVGVRPYDSDQRSLPGLLEAIRESENRKTSETFARLEPDVGLAVAGSRRTTPERLTRALAGDLDAIVSKAKATEPSERYSSVELLSEDVGRHLAHVPVLARSAGWSTRLRKVVKRQPLLAAGVALTALLAVGGSLATAWHLQRVQDERIKALAAQERAEDVADFIVDIFEVSDPSLGLRSQPTIDEAIEQMSVRVDQTLKERPEVLDEVRNAIGNLYINLGAYRDARTYLNAVLTDSDEPLAGTPTHIKALVNLGRLELLEGNLIAAEGWARTAVASAEVLFSDDDPRLLASLFLLAEINTDRGYYETARRLHESVLKSRSDAGDSDVREVLQSLRALADLNRESGQLRLAETQIQQALDLALERFGRWHIEVANLYSTVGRVEHSLGDLDAAKGALTDALSIYSRVLPKDHPLLIGVMHELATVHGSSGDYAQSAELMAQALSVAELQDNVPGLAALVHDSAIVYDLLGRHSEAIPLYRRARVLLAEVFGENHRSVANAIFNLGTLYQEQGDFDQARTSYQNACKMYRVTLDEGSLEDAQCVLILGEIDRLQGRAVEASESVVEAEEKFRQLSPTHRYLPWALYNKARLAMAASDYAAAEAQLNEAGKILAASVNPTSPEALSVSVALGEVMVLQGKLNEARVQLQGVASVGEDLDAEERANPEVRSWLAANELALAETVEQSAAAAHLLRAVELLQSTELVWVEARSNLARAYYLLGQPDLADEIVRELDSKGWRDPRLERARQQRHLPSN